MSEQDTLYLDNAATTLKAEPVLRAISDYYRFHCAPIHRSAYPRGYDATEAYEAGRQKVADFIGAAANEVIVTKSATEGINQVAYGWALPRLKSGKQIWITDLEHNANYLPWQRVCDQTGATLRRIAVNDDGSLDLDEPDIWGEDTVLIAVSHCSNVIGGEFPVKEICQRASGKGIAVLVDAAQSVGHQSLDIRDIGCDFLVFSAHKMYGPEGIGILYCHSARQQQMSPLLLGGGIVSDISTDGNIKWLNSVERFESGSPHAAGMAGLVAAIDSVQYLGIDNIKSHLFSLESQARTQLQALPEVSVLPRGGAAQGSCLLSFSVKGVHPHDLADVIWESAGISLRTGSHCAHLLMNRYQMSALTRISFAAYNSDKAMSSLTTAVKKAINQFG
ncbi:hypothetical protein A8L45_16365 [Veronia pacifica]|uniref:cysteine desulfurase n=2 Tax=Veronia pacifica TaxID=1080227 RepID=A0A1C3EEE8_9GAMM|nr:hypothetical protein A8L45_16365 [Veronia pacifica]